MNIDSERAKTLSPEEKRVLLEQLLKKKAKAAQPTLRAIPQQPREAANYPLSFAQQRLWYLDQLNPGNPVYNLPILIRMEGVVDVIALEQSLNNIVARHESLRVNFTAIEGEPVQAITPSRTLFVSQTDLRHLPPAERQAEADRLTEEEARRPFNLSKDLLLRAVLLQLAENQFTFLLVAHHIVADGWSFGLLVQELAAFYRAIITGQTDALPSLPIQYIDFVHWQHESFKNETLASQIDYWKQQLGTGLSPLVLPLDYQRPSVQTFESGRETLKLPEGLSKALKTLGEQEGATLFMVLLATFYELMYRYTGQTDVTVGTPIAGRNRAEIEKLIGMFVNNLVLRANISGEASFRELLKQVRRVALEAYDHQDVPFEGLLAELKPERKSGHTPFFQVFFNMLNIRGTQLELPGLVIDMPTPPEVGSLFDLTLYTFEKSKKINLILVYNAALFTQARMVELLAQYEYLLTQIAANPDQKLNDFSLVTGRANAYLPNPTQAQKKEWLGPVQTRFSGQAGRTPHRLALIDKQSRWTYQQLETRSNQLAHYLLAAGIKPQEVVAVYGHRSATLVWAVLGVLKAGAAFVILDSAYPPQRLIDYLKIAQPQGWLQLEAAGPLPLALMEFVNTSIGNIQLELPQADTKIQPLLKDYPTDMPAIAVGPDDLAYISFTSGSTGQPKGILGSHSPLSHFFRWHSQTFGFTEADRFSLLSGLAHDPLLRDIFTPLEVGATLCIPDSNDIAIPGQLAAWMRQQEITVAHLTPPLIQVLAGEETSTTTVKTLRYAFSGGDMLTQQHLSRLRQLAPAVTCVNFYGATETPQAMGYFVAPTENDINLKDNIPLGRGIEDVQLLVLNTRRQLAGVGELGEIYIRTPYLAKGYLEDESLTQARFITNPFTQANDDRLYKSGDLGRYLPDGQVEFAGRIDHQVKIRGFRIELGEIETVLRRHPAIREAVVIVREDTPGDKRLAAYLIPQPGTSPTADELRTLARKNLPDYMIPAAFVFLEAYPLTPNKKIDRQALPLPQSTQSAPADNFVTPRTPLETLIAGIWQEALGVEQVSVYDNFFDLGGHSLLSVRVMARLEQEIGVKLPLALVGYQTLGQMAAAYEAKLPPTDPRRQSAPADSNNGSGHAVDVKKPVLANTTVPEIEPFFFGPADEQLFGCYHPPLSAQPQDFVVVFCYPMGQEYIRSHRACQQLAVRLARAGFPVLRFDFLGCGDSAGRAEDGHLARWQRDIAAAITEAKARSGRSKVYLAGLRLGASLALLAAAQRDDVAGLALWEPVINGKTHLAELADQHQKALWYFAGLPGRGAVAEHPTEILGFPLTATLAIELENLNLLAAHPGLVQKILIVENGETPVTGLLQKQLQQSRAKITHRHVPGFSIWIENTDKGLVPGQTLQAIISWMLEASL